MTEIVINRDVKGLYRWTKYSSDGEQVAYSQGGFQRKAACLADAKRSFVLGWRASEQLLAVEGLKMSPALKRRLNEFSKAKLPHEERLKLLKAAFAAGKI